MKGRKTNGKKHASKERKTEMHKKRKKKNNGARVI